MVVRSFYALILLSCAFPLRCSSEFLGRKPAVLGPTVCKVVIQGAVRNFPPRSSFNISNVDILCSGARVTVQGHPALDPFKDKFEGIDYSIPRNPKSLVYFVGAKRLTIVNSTFSNLRIRDDQMYILTLTDGSEVTLQDSNFFNNTGSFKSPIRVTQNSSAIIDRCTFVNSTSTQAGVLAVLAQSKVQVNASAFTDNGYGRFMPEAGVMFVRNSEASISSSSVTQNSGTRAGAFVVMDGGSLTVNQSSVVVNTATGGASTDMPGQQTGGAFVVVDSQVRLLGTAMNENQGSDAGAGYVAGQSVVTLDYMLLHRNRSKNKLSALLLSGYDPTASGPNNVTLVLEEASFWDNDGVKVACQTGLGAAQRIDLAGSGVQLRVGTYEEVASGQVSC